MNSLEIIINVIISLICGFVSGLVVYILTKRKEKQKEIYNYWYNFLFDTLKYCEMYIPVETIKNIKYVDESHKTEKQSASTVVSNSKIIIPLSGLIDLNEEIKRQNKRLEKLISEKTNLLARTNNEKFMANAKPELIEQTKSRIEEIIIQENAIKQLISSLK